MIKPPRHVRGWTSYLVWNSPRMDVILYPSEYRFDWIIANGREYWGPPTLSKRSRLVLTGLSPRLVIEDPTPDQLRSVLHLFEKMA